MKVLINFDHGWVLSLDHLALLVERAFFAPQHVERNTPDPCGALALVYLLSGQLDPLHL